MSTPLPLGPLKRFGILGGSFNPVHVGHLSIAQQTLNALKLERVFLMPAALPPHKQGNGELAAPEDRLAMCHLAVRQMHGLDVSSLELQRPGPSYTVETARQLRTAYGPTAEIRFLIGSDSLAELPTWREIDELLKLADFAIAARRETPLDETLWANLAADLGPEAAAKLRRSVVEIERVDVSSSLVRRLLRTGQPLRGYLRRDVEEYIRWRSLYGAPAEPVSPPPHVRA